MTPHDQAVAIVAAALDQNPATVAQLSERAAEHPDTAREVLTELAQLAALGIHFTATAAAAQSGEAVDELDVLADFVRAHDDDGSDTPGAAS